MLRAFHAVTRARAAKRVCWRALAACTLAGALALATTGTTVRADGNAAGSVEVSGLTLPVQLSCPPGCSFSSNATSTGDITGVDGTTPFEASWSNTGFSATIGYISTCLMSAWRDAQLTTDSTATISGVTLVYGTTTYTGASAKLTFGGYIAEGAFVPITSMVEIDGGPAPIQVFIPIPGSPGALATVPAGPPPVPCAGNSQTFTASGTFLALG